MQHGAGLHSARPRPDAQQPLARTLGRTGSSEYPNRIGSGWPESIGSPHTRWCNTEGALT
eukprot:6512578-Pyramimonas_sp.AAC.1